jgi:hypothetical protein
MVEAVKAMKARIKDKNEKVYLTPKPLNPTPETSKPYTLHPTP